MRVGRSIELSPKTVGYQETLSLMSEQHRKQGLTPAKPPPDMWQLPTKTFVGGWIAMRINQITRELRNLLPEQHLEEREIRDKLHRAFSTGRAVGTAALSHRFCFLGRTEITGRVKWIEAVALTSICSNQNCHPIPQRNTNRRNNRCH